MRKSPLNPDQIDAVLPQTQCGLCEHGGCRPYAEAIAFEGELINKCPPGGMKVLKQLAMLTGIDPEPYFDEMEQKAKPAQKVIIREDLCIGCTKCIQACPVDAILGASKVMHTVIQDQCTGCELCIEPCPMDCIDIIPSQELSEPDQLAFSNLSRQRFEDRTSRLERDNHERRNKHQQAKAKQSDRNKTINARQEAIKEAIARAKAKKGASA